MNKVRPQCMSCKHWGGWRGPIGTECPAFPDSLIPAAIIGNEHDHREPYPGDHGIRFEPIEKPEVKP